MTMKTKPWSDPEGLYNGLHDTKRRFILRDVGFQHTSMEQVAASRSPRPRFFVRICAEGITSDLGVRAASLSCSSVPDDQMPALRHRMCAGSPPAHSPSRARNASIAPMYAWDGP